MSLEEEVALLFRSTMLSETMTDEEGIRERHVACPASLTGLSDEIEALLAEVAGLSVALNALRESTLLALRRLAREIEDA